MVHNIPSKLLLLPSELKHRIAELSSCNSLASLARTHTAYQREAEQALYRTLYIHTRDDDSLKCLNTLATNPEKAGFVCFLTMECVPSENNENRRAMTYLINALIHMHSLSDFRLRTHCDEAETWIKDLDDILCNINFRLQTLYCNNILDLPRIIRSQNELQILGIYNNCHKESFMESLKRLQNAQLHLPVVVTLEQESYFPFDKISIFPAFYSSDRCSTFHQVLAESFEKDRGSSDIWTYVGGVFELFIYLVDSCDMPSIHALTKSMAMRFPQINSLTFCFEHQCDIASQEMKKIVSLFPDLYELNFNLWPGCNRNGEIIPEDIKMICVKDWELACPKLMLVSFIDGSMLQKRGVWGNEWLLRSW